MTVLSTLKQVNQRIMSALQMIMSVPPIHSKWSTN